MLWLLSPIAISTVLGWLLLRLFFRPVGTYFPPIFYGALGFPLGAGLFTLCAFLMFLARQPGALSILIAFGVPAVLTLIAAWAQRTKGIFHPARIESCQLGNGKVVTLFWIVCGAACLAAALLFASAYSAFPHGMSDAQSMWNGRARVMFRAPALWRNVFSMEQPHPDYPLSLSILVFTGWIGLHRETQIVPLAIAVAYLFASATTVGLGLSIHKNVLLGLAGASVVLCSVGYVSLAGAQYADVPLSALFVVALILFTLAYRDGRPNYPGLVLAGAAAGFCGWMKNEGIGMASCDIGQPPGNAVVAVACVSLSGTRSRRLPRGTIFHKAGNAAKTAKGRR